MSDDGSFDQLDLEIKSKAEKLDAWCPKKAMEKGWGGPKLTRSAEMFTRSAISHSITNQQYTALPAVSGFLPSFPLKSSFP